jgi:putative ATPase
MPKQADLPIDASAEARHRPLAARMRPANLSEFVGQQHLLAPGRPLHRLLTEGVTHSMVLWGPPGSGKTTLARLPPRAALIRLPSPHSAIRRSKLQFSLRHCAGDP